MEDWQKLHIENNLRKLIENTKCSSVFNSYLVEKGCISEEELESLTILADTRNGRREAMEMYTILKTRIGGYEVLLEALDGTCQTGALKILRDGKLNRVITQEEKTIRIQRFKTISVEVSCKVTPVTEMFPCLTDDQIFEVWQCTDAEREILDLHRNPRTLKLDADLPKLHDLYIQRSISNRLILDPEIFKINCKDTFVIKGLERNALAELVHPHVTRASSTQLSVITCRDINLDDDEDWDDLILVTKVPLHRVHKEDDEYVLYRSTEVTSILQQYCVHSSRNKEAYVSEGEFAKQLIDGGNDKGALLCDVPGMGKTWFMHSIASRLRTTAAKSLVIFVQLSSLGVCIDNRSMEDDALIFLLKFVKCSSLASRLLRKLAETNGMKIFFLLDGFDEIRDEFMEKVTLFISQLKEYKFVNLIISARSHMRSELEKSFNLISYDILPFGLDEQVKTIVEHWKKVVPEADETKLNPLAHRTIESFKVIQQKKAMDILGVPLRCYLLAVVNEILAGQVCKKNRTKEFVDAELARVRSISDLYQQFVEQSVDKVLQTHSYKPTAEIQYLILQYHTFRALELLFPEIADVYNATMSVDMSLKEVVAKVGVLLVNHKTKLEFTHRSFAEYFAGKFLAEFWMDVGSYHSVLVESVGVCFINKIIKTKLEENDIRRLDLRYNSPTIMYSLEQKTMYEWIHRFAGFSWYTVLWFMNSISSTHLDELTSVKIFKQQLRSRVSIMKKILSKTRIVASTISLCKASLQVNTYGTLIACIDYGLTSILRLLVEIVTSFFMESQRKRLLRVKA